MTQMPIKKRIHYFLFIVGAPILSLVVAILCFQVSTGQAGLCAGGDLAAFIGCNLAALSEILALLSITGIVWPLLLSFSMARLCRDVVVAAGDRAHRFRGAVSTVAGSVVAIQLVQGAALALAAAELEFVLTGRSVPILAGAIALATLWIGGNLARALFRSRIRERESIVAVSVDPAAQPALWKSVSGLAAELGLSAPRHVLLGLQPTFYASVAEAVLAEDQNQTILQGSALHLSLPLMRLLDRGELDAVVRHELCHLAHADPQDALAIHAACLRLGDIAGGVARLNLLGLLIALPAVTLVHYCLSCLRIAEQALRRRGELRADRVAARTAGPEALVSALVKIEFAARSWPELDQTIVQALQQGSAFINVSETFATGVGREMRQFGPDRILETIERQNASAAPRTHPGVAERCENLGISSAKICARLHVTPKPHHELIRDTAAIEQLLSQRYQRRLVSAGHAPLPGSAPPPSSTLDRAARGRSSPPAA